MAVKSTSPARPSQGRAQAKLSSGLLGMKFMQKEDSAPDGESTGEPEAAATKGEDNKAASPSSDDTRHGRNNYTQADPGVWSLPNRPARTSHKGSGKSRSVGFADLYATSAGVQGRRTYGKAPNTVNPEDMATTYVEKSAGKTPKGKPPKEKRLSSSKGDQLRKRRSEDQLDIRDNAKQRRK